MRSLVLPIVVLALPAAALAAQARIFTGSALLNEEAVRRFSHDNTWVLGRKSHLEPTLVRPLAELGPETDVIQALICGELEP